MYNTTLGFFYERAPQFCAGMCKIWTKECAKVHSMKYKEYVQCMEIII